MEELGGEPCGGDDEWSEARLRAEPLEALAAYLADFGTGSAYPLVFGVSVEELDTLSGTTADERSRGDHQNEASELEGLRMCARLCALSDDESGDTDAAQSAAAALDLFLQGSLCPQNDLEAARLVASAAASQLVLLREASPPLTPGATGVQAPLGGVRPECVALAGDLRRSEAAVLSRLCESDDVGSMFGVGGWAVAWDASCADLSET